MYVTSVIHKDWFFGFVTLENHIWDVLLNYRNASKWENASETEGNDFTIGVFQIVCLSNQNSIKGIDL